MKISVVIITYNEEENIEHALTSVENIASEIIIVDSFSADGTVQLAQKYTDKVYQRKWKDYSDQKNYANSLANFPWILSLDADERVSPELHQEISEIKKKEPSCNGFSIPRKVRYLGKWINHSGWYPDRKIRLFRKDSATWRGEYVHESLVVKGDVLQLKHPIYHFTHKNIEDHVSTINRFSTLAAKKLYGNNKKCRWYHLALIPTARFIKTYFLKLGFLDGFPGLVIAALGSYSVFIRYAKLKELWKTAGKN